MLTHAEQTELGIRLQEELDKVVAEMSSLREGAGVVELDQTSVGRLSRMDAMQQQAMSQELRHRAQYRFRRINAAMERQTDGRYGRCCDCAEWLSLERLRVDPAAPFCADCQSAIDLRNKAHR